MMALIKCPNCGNEVSNMAKNCPNCQFAISHSAQKNSANLCKECGGALSVNDTACPKCGYPVSIKKKPANVNQVQKKKSKSGKKVIVVLIILLILIALTVLSVFTVDILKKNNILHDPDEYAENLESASIMMLQGAADAEEAGNLIKSVWYNSIYEKKDKETDKYTLNSKGYFNDDFNDSLSALFSDSEFQEKIADIISNKDSVTELVKTLKNPPYKYKEAYSAIIEYYNSYLKFVNIVTNPSGSLNSFSEEFNAADTETVKLYEAMGLYIE